MKKLNIFVLLLALTILLPLASVGRANALPTDLNHLIGDRIGEPQDIDPAWAYDTASAELLMNVYDPLLWFNRTEVDTFMPKLATSWTIEQIDETSPEGIPWVYRYTFTIREGVYFHTDGVNDIPGEGQLLTPQDVEYTVERMMVTDAPTGPAWMYWEPLFGGAAWAGDVDAMLTDLGWPVNETTGWNTKMDEAIDHSIESDATTVWFNLGMPYEPFLQVCSQNWGSIMNQAWCIWHGDWPGQIVGDDWYLWTGPATSPLYDLPNGDTSSPGPRLNAALGTGPYMLDYWDRGAGNAWSIIKNDAYWMGWEVPFTPEGWGDYTIDGHVTRYTSNYIPEWATRRLRLLGGVADFCDVPRMYIGQIIDQPGIHCDFPLVTLACDGVFLNFLVNSASTHLGVVQPNSTFSEFGAPPNIMEDLDFRIGMAHMFDYQTYLYAAFVNEGVSPVSPIVEPLPYRNETLGQREDPVLDLRKKYGISFEAAGQLAYDLAKAREYLLTAWGGEVWAHGFTMDAVYNEGNLPRQVAAQLMGQAFDDFNALYGTRFTMRVTSIPWNAYRTEQRARVMPYFIVGWLADYPDPHNFIHPFMHSVGAFSRWQGYKGITSFPNQMIDDYITAGIMATNPAERESIYGILQQYYVDFMPGWCTLQGIGRHWERDWVGGWFYNAVFPGNYIYDLWKEVTVTVQDVDVAITSMTEVVKLEVGYPVPDSGAILPLPSPIDVTVSRLDTNGAVPAVPVVIGIGLRDADGVEYVLDVEQATLTVGGNYVASFFDLTNNDPGLLPGTYTLFAQVLVQIGFAQDTNAANNIAEQAGVEATYFIGDANLDGSVDMADISLCIDAFMTDPFSPLWDIVCDFNSDASVDMADISICIDAFMQVFDP